MTHRLENSGEYEDPREALRAEFARTPELEKKLADSKRRGALIRATRAAAIDDGLDLLFRKILGGNQ